MSSPVPTPEEVDRLNDEAARLINGQDPKQLLEVSERALDMAREISYKKGEGYGLGDQRQRYG